MAKWFVHKYPGRTIVGALLFKILLGTLLLHLPFCTTKTISLIDLFFTSCSATTVTGLLAVPLNSFTIWGQLILLALIQIGGLGLITMLLFFMSMFVNMGLTSQFMASELFEVKAIRDIKQLLKFTIKLTALCETIGAFIIFFSIYKLYPLKEALFKAIFQSVSSFCNAGITPFTQSMAEFTTNAPVLCTTALLSFIGGFGFFVLYQLTQRFILKRKVRISLHTKIVVWAPLIIIITGSVLFWILEHHNTLAQLSLPYQWLNAFFNTMCMRSTGFLSVQFNNLQLASIFMMMIIGFIGSSPGSTGSGIKTTTFAIILATTKAIFSGREFVYIKRRKIKKIQVYRSVAIVIVALTWITITTFLLLIIEKNHPFLDVLFESVAAFSNLGITSGLTPTLTNVGKLLIAASEIAGRIGSLTLILAFAKTTGERDFLYPEERIMLG